MKTNKSFTEYVTKHGLVITALILFCTITYIFIKNEYVRAIINIVFGIPISVSMCAIYDKIYDKIITKRNK